MTVCEASAEAPMSEPAQPVEAVNLIVSELRLQRTGDGGLQPLHFLQSGDVLPPVGIDLEVTYLVHQILKSEGGERVDAHAFSVLF